MKKNIYLFIIGTMILSSCDKIEDMFGSDDKPNIKKGLVLHYTFDDQNAEDLSGNNYDGAFVSAPTFVSDTPDNTGKAVFINGFKEDALNIPYNPVEDSCNYSVSMWLKDFAAGDIIKSVEGESTGRLCALSLTAKDDRSFQFRTYTSSYDVYVFSEYNYSDIQEDGWHLITITVDGKLKKEMKLYVDGSLVDVTSISRSLSTGSKFIIGGGVEPINSFKIDNLRLYNRCISSDEVKLIYSSEK